MKILVYTVGEQDTSGQRGIILITHSLDEVIELTRAIAADEMRLTIDIEEMEVKTYINRNRDNLNDEAIKSLTEMDAK